ncbi:MAG: hypothetical protein ACRD6X_16120, partial [Pyrinomonadaceae bacterium]
MKNKTSILFAFVILAAIGLGCSSINPFSGSKETGSSSSDSKDKTTADKVVDTSVGESRIGVPECDEVSDLIEIELKNPDDGYFTKAIKRTYFN